ncbi:unnamed protein product [Danaus chrysippus]|uniref:(African queen) hypothetical protein n=1 Tax=Danaus chrysippus TaxID=151541 RepID=A0A8J2QSM9_9NEOP|nr:unnamed protein product [Danaus chrysippus]
MRGEGCGEEGGGGRGGGARGVRGHWNSPRELSVDSGRRNTHPITDHKADYRPSGALHNPLHTGGLFERGVARKSSFTLFIESTPNG